MLFQPTRQDVYFFFYECWHGKKIFANSPIHQLGINVLSLHHEEALSIFGIVSVEKIKALSLNVETKQNIWQEHQQYEKTHQDSSESFRHWSLHLAVMEQVKANQPFGISDEFNRLGNFYRDAHTNIDVIHSVYHHMMQVLSEVLIQQLPPQMYLERLKK